jgi:hypothetical protein
MTPNSIAILANPDPSGHIVYPYTDEAHVSNAVCLFAGSGLRKGEAVILVMAKDHFKPVQERLEADGFNVARLEAAGQLVCCEAEKLLTKFMFDGILDELKFTTTIGDLIEKAKQNGGGRPVRVFGEMVELIWRAHPNTTHRMEELWNHVVKLHSVPLLCAYSLIDSKPDTLPAGLLACHSHAVA